MRKYIYLIAIFFGMSGIGITHELRPAYLEIKAMGEETYSVLFKVPGRGPEKRLALYLQLPADTKFISPSKITFTGSAFIERSTIKREGGLAGTEIGINGLSKTLTDALVRIEHKDGNVLTVRLTPQSPSFIVQASPGKYEVIKTYFALGVEHILLGIDHLLFLVCLLIIAKTARRILITITGFTIAHSITLVLSALKVVNLPVPPIEAMIALSIVFVTCEIARGPSDTITYKYPVLVSASFGLLHGFGFASALKDIGLAQKDIALSLLFFNVGVEIGQLIFISVIVILILVLRNIINQSYNYILNYEKPAAYVIGCLASLWMIQRVYSFWF